MPPFTLIQLRPRGVVVMASILETTPQSGPTQGQRIVIIVVVISFSLVATGIFVCWARRLVRRCSNRSRIREVQEGPNEDPIPLQELQPAEDRGNTAANVTEPTGPTTVAPATNRHAAPSTSTSGSSYEAEIPGPTILGPPPPPRTVNQFNEALSSHPPTEADLEVAANALRDRTNIARGLEPVAEAGPSTQQSPPEELTIPEQAPTLPPRSERRISLPQSVLIPGSRFTVFVAGYNYAEGSMSQATPEHTTTSGTHSRDDHPESPAQGSDTNNANGRQSLLSRLHRNRGGHLSFPGVNFIMSISYNTITAFVKWMNKGKEIDDYGLNKDNHKLGDNTNVLELPEPTHKSDNQYSSLNRDYTHPSMVPAPLAVSQHGINSVREASSRAATSALTPANLGLASVASPDISLVEPEITNRRPTSFSLHDWPPQRWRMPPPDEIIERNRQRQANREWEQEAKVFIQQRAKEAGESLSEEEVNRRVKRMFRRKSRALEISNRVAALNETPPNMTSYFDTDDEPTVERTITRTTTSSPPGLAFASSQALPRAESSSTGTRESSRVALPSPYPSPPAYAHRPGPQSPPSDRSRFRRSQ
ncbi:hypothetical protein F4678DRAFT_482370 [Xylaria arbuscula]|nr:hypothetical protein F4678DRAFT_482370 [Xylaria arbuscula]